MSDQNSTSPNWLNAKGYAQGVFWITLVALVSCGNDILMRNLGSRLPSMEIAFFRFFFATVILTPIMIANGKAAFATSRPVLHILRALLGFGAVACWCYGVGQAPLATVSTIALTVPLFVLPMAFFILGERVGWERTAATFAGFIGILFIVLPDALSTDLSSGSLVTLGSVVLLIAAVLFAMSDILNKFMVSKESSLTMLFYFALGTSIVGFIPAYMNWISPTLQEYGLLFCLGFGGNAILYCLLKAFSAVDVSALAPYRYTELIFATLFGFTFFDEIPGYWAWVGSAIIVCATFAIAYFENKQNSQKQTTSKATKEAA